MFDSGWFVWLIIGVLGLFGIGLAYFVAIGVRSIYRGARHTASEAGHRRGSAAVRAMTRMTIWALFFGAYYLFVYFLGRRLGWQAAIPSAVGLMAMVWALLQADRLLTIGPDAVRQQVGIGVRIAVVLAVFVAVIIWLAAV
jgi:hypothetical protein